MGYALHLVWSCPDHSTIAFVIDLDLILGDHVSENEVGGFIVVGLDLKIFAPLHQGIHLGELGLCGLLLEALFLLLVLDLLGGPSSAAFGIDMVRLERTDAKLKLRTFSCPT